MHVVTLAKLLINYTLSLNWRVHVKPLHWSKTVTWVLGYIGTAPIKTLIRLCHVHLPSQWFIQTAIVTASLLLPLFCWFHFHPNVFYHTSSTLCKPTCHNNHTFVEVQPSISCKASSTVISSVIWSKRRCVLSYFSSPQGLLLRHHIGTTLECQNTKQIQL